MKATVTSTAALAAAAVLACCAALAAAQYGEPNATMPLAMPGDARLFVVDVGDQVHVLDLPTGRTTARLDLPHPSVLTRMSHDHRFFIAFRARSYPPEYMTVIRTGVLRNYTGGKDVPYADPYTLPPGPVVLAGLPHITRTIDVGSSLVPSHDGYLGFHPYYNSYIMAEEKAGVILMFNASMLEDTAAWAPIEWDLGTPDHYAVSPYGPHLYIGYIAEGKVRLVTMEGEVLEEHNCSGVHGTVDFQDESMEAQVSAFGCTDGILLVYGNGTSYMLSTPTRVGSFIHGFNGNVFGVGRDLTTLYHVNLKSSEPSITDVPSGGERRRHTEWHDYSMFAQIHSNGNLTVHNGTDGSIVAYTAVQDFAIDSAAVPALEVYEGNNSTQIFVTQPSHGMLLAVRLDMDAATPAERARVAEQIYVGGRPVGLMLAH